jgi:hypothetical protein
MVEDVDDEDDDEDEDEEDEDELDELLPSGGSGTGTIAYAADSRPSCRMSAPARARRGLRTEGSSVMTERIRPNTQLSEQVDRVPRMAETHAVFR